MGPTLHPAEHAGFLGILVSDEEEAFRLGQDNVVSWFEMGEEGFCVLGRGGVAMMYFI